MPDQPKSHRRTKNNPDKSHHTPPPASPPAIIGNKNDEGENGEGGGKYLAEREDSHPHWTRYAEAGCAIALVLITATYTFYASRQACAALKAANAAKGAADTAARQLELTERPWVFVKDAKVISPLVFDKSGGHVTFEITVRNAGQSPAVNVFIAPRLYTLPGQEESIEPAERLCNAGFYHGDIRGGIMLFPNTDSPPQRITVGLGEEDIEKARRRPPFQGRLPIVITPLICVLYRPTFKDVGYSSGIQYDLWPAVWPEKTPAIPESNLPLHSSGFFGESAH